MKTLIVSFFTLLCTTSFSQTIFESEADVLQHLTNRGSFTNKETNITLTFSDMGTTLSSGRASYFNPDVTLVSITRAVVKYQSLNNPDATVQFIVDSNENVLMDRRDRSIYKAYAYEEEQSEKPVIKQIYKPTVKKKTVTSAKKKS